MKYVYAIGPSDGPYKIGISSNVRARLAALQTGYPVPIKIHLSATSVDARTDESKLHQALAASRINGEWFSVAINAVIDAFSCIGLNPTRHHPAPNETATTMPADSFCEWLAQMSNRPFYKSERECAIVLGLPEDAIKIMKRDGADLRTALACRALLHRLEPYGAG